MMAGSDEEFEEFSRLKISSPMYAWNVYIIEDDLDDSEKVKDADIASGIAPSVRQAAQDAENVLFTKIESAHEKMRLSTEARATIDNGILIEDLPE